MSLSALSSVSVTSKRVACFGVCMDAQSAKAAADFFVSVPGGASAGNAERYMAAEREARIALDAAQLGICIVDLDRNPDEANWTVEQLRKDDPDLFIFGVSSSSSPDRIIAAMRSGCAEYLIKPLTAEALQDALARSEQKHQARPRSRARGKVVTIMGAKGGTGVTTLALHLALSLANNTNRKCLLIDQHPALGDASLYLGTGRHKYSFFELAGNTERLDEELLQGFLLHHDSGLDLLDSPETLDAIPFAPPSSIEQTISFLSETYPHVVVDCPPGLTEGALASVGQSDQLAVVMTAELPSVRNAVRYLEYLSKLGFNPANVKIVLNRYSKKGPLSDDKIEKALQHPIAYRIPNSYQEVVRCINAGMPVQPGDKSDFAAAIDAWARDLGADSRAGTAAAAAGSSGKLLNIFKR